MCVRVCLCVSTYMSTYSHMHTYIYIHIVFLKLECQAKVARPQLDLVKALQNSISEEENVKKFQERYGNVTHLWMTHTYDVTYEWHTLTCLWMRLDPFKYEIWLIYSCDMVRLHTRHISFEHVTKLIYMWDMIPFPRRRISRNSRERFVLWCIYIWDRIYFHIRHDSFICEVWLNYAWNMTHVKMRHDSFTDMISRMSRNSGRRTVMWLIYIWDMTHLQMWGRSCRSATHCDTPQHTATHRNTLQHNTGDEDVGQNALFDPWENEWPPPESIGTSRVRVRAVHLRHDSFTYETWPWIYWYITYVCEWFKSETWLIYLWDMPHLQMRHDAFPYEWPPPEFIGTLHVFVRDLHMRHDSFTYETWLIYIWDMTQNLLGHRVCV